nr:hypothetical protein CFP56_68123 [Quercus suber]
MSRTGLLRQRTGIVFPDKVSQLSNVNAYQDEKIISYSKNRSRTLAKLTGTMNQPEPPTAPVIQTSASGPSSLPKKPTELAVPTNTGVQDAPSPQGVKRPRVDSESEAVKRPRSLDSFLDGRPGIRLSRISGIFWSRT